MSYAITHCIHLPLRQASGAPVDALGNTTPAFIGTTTNAWAEPSYLTFTNGASLSIEIVGAYVDEMMRLDTLNGAIFWSAEIWHAAAPGVGTRDYLLAYGNWRSIATGGYAFGIGSNDNFLLQYGEVGGTAPVSHPNDLCVPMTAGERSRWIQIGACIHRDHRGLMVAGFLRGRTSRGTRLFSLEGKEPIVNSSFGLHLFGEAASAGAAQNEWGNEAGMNARARNVVIARIEGDAYTQIPRWMYDLRSNPERPEIVRAFNGAARVLVS